ncbi:hypothetical protein P154DRAFT_578348 [Amniculicola lignicola CBS 123094]|uniref:Uncharacterized protein n=1 Tax=Amniculicola lignicola CBS 123094 TaxID=1392246 RepID=A0A6A5WAY4_9PLEO|nr:hypothetical protein P154DRAFT_578348 [Amniculicola lignicola CBS 123094]
MTATRDGSPGSEDGANLLCAVLTSLVQVPEKRADATPITSVEKLVCRLCMGDHGKFEVSHPRIPLWRIDNHRRPFFSISLPGAASASTAPENHRRQVSSNLMPTPVSSDASYVIAAPYADAAHATVPGGASSRKHALWAAAPAHIPYFLSWLLIGVPAMWHERKAFGDENYFMILANA